MEVSLSVGKPFMQNLHPTLVASAAVIAAATMSSSQDKEVVAGVA